MQEWKMQEWKMQEYTIAECKAEPILYSDTVLSASLKLWWFLFHFRIVEAFLFYSDTDSLLDTAFVMWCKVVVNINYTGFKGYLNADF